MRITIIISLLTNLLFAQDWQSVTAVNNINDIVTVNNEIWAATEGGILRYNIAENEYEIITNIEGLRDVNVTALLKLDNQVIAGTEGGLLQSYDLDINRWAVIYNFEGESIQDIQFAKNILWVALGNQISVFVRQNNTFVFNDIFKSFPELISEIRSLTVYKDRIYGATDTGLLSATTNLFVNLNDKNNWKLFKQSNGLTSNSINYLATYNDLLFIATNAGLNTHDQNSIFNIAGFTNQNITYLLPDEKLLVASANSLFEYTIQNGIELQTNYRFQITAIGKDINNKIWLGQASQGLFDINGSKLEISGPVFNISRYILKDQEGRLWSASGKFASLLPPDGFNIYNNNHWVNYKYRNEGWVALKNTCYFYEDRFNNIWIGSWGGGLMVFHNNDFSYFHNYKNEGQIVITSTDTIINKNIDPNPDEYRGFFSPAPISIPDYEVVTAMIEGPNGRLWIANTQPENDQYIVSVPYTSDGFISLESENRVYFGREDGINAVNFPTLAFDSFGRLWIGTYDDGVFILDFNNTLSDKSDDEIIRWDLENLLFSNSIRSIVRDQDGVMWIGTAGGLNSFDGSFLISNSTLLFRHVGSTGGPINNTINQIFVDDYNNKWIATDGGLTVLTSTKSAFDSTAWKTYTSENSGLIDNRVNTVFIDNQSGTAYIGTENGISFFKGEFSEIRPDYKQVAAGPNPFVLDGVNDRFVITNLKQNSSLKIFSLNGTLIKTLSVEDGTINGSRAHWNGKDFDGNEVASGIYLYLAYTEDGKAVSGKIAVIRK